MSQKNPNRGVIENLDAQALKEHQIDPLKERVDKCYSRENYQEFQEAVEKIAERYLRGKLGWGVLLWLITLIASMLLQKFFGIF